MLKPHTSQAFSLVGLIRSAPTVFMRTKHSLDIFGVIPFMKLQKDTWPTVKLWKMRCRTKTLTCFWLSCVVFLPSVWKNQESVHSVNHFATAWEEQGNDGAYRIENALNWQYPFKWPDHTEHHFEWPCWLMAEALVLLRHFEWPCWLMAEALVLLRRFEWLLTAGWSVGGATSFWMTVLTDGWSVGVATSFWMTVLTAGWSIGGATSFWMTILTDGYSIGVCSVCFQPERIDPPDPSRPDYDIRADVWSLGISLVSEVFSGQWPACFAFPSVFSQWISFGVCVCVGGGGRSVQGGAALLKLEFVLVPYHSLHFLLHSMHKMSLSGECLCVCVYGGGGGTIVKT